MRLHGTGNVWAQFTDRSVGFVKNLQAFICFVYVHVETTTTVHPLASPRSSCCPHCLCGTFIRFPFCPQRGCVDISFLKRPSLVLPFFLQQQRQLIEMDRLEGKEKGLSCNSLPFCRILNGHQSQCFSS